MSKDRAKRPLIVVADDEETIRESLRRRLSMPGYDVETAEDGAAALDIVSREFVNLVVADIHMPGLDGIELLRRATAASPDTQMIIMTAQPALETAAAACRFGAYDYLQKPFSSLDDVAHKVALALERQRLELQNRALLEKLKTMNEALKQVLVARSRELEAARQVIQDAARRGVHVAGSLATLLQKLVEADEAFRPLLGEEGPAREAITGLFEELRGEVRRLTPEAMGGV